MKLRFFLFSFLALVGGVLGHEHHPQHVRRTPSRDLENTKKRSSRRCGTRTPTTATRAATELALAVSRVRAKNRRKRGIPYQANAPKTVPTCFHFVRTDTNDFFLRRKEVKVNLDALNVAFGAGSCCDEALDWCTGQCSSGGDTGFRFELAKTSWLGRRVVGTTRRFRSPHACITRRRNRAYKDWAWDEALDEQYDDLDLDIDQTEVFKKVLRKGDATVLNVYVVDMGQETSTLGFATFPSEYIEIPLLDGVVMNKSTVVGGEEEDSNEGGRFVRFPVLLEVYRF